MGYARRMRLPLGVLLLSLSTACSGPSAPPAPTKGSESETRDAPRTAPALAEAKAAKAAPDDGFAKPEASGVVSLGDISLEVPGSWIKVPPQSGMRLAQYDIPGNGGAGSMAVFRFPGGGGSASANLARWKGQLQPGPDTRPPEEKVATVAGLTVTSLDAVGRFAPGPMPGAPAAAPIERARMLAAVIEGAGDPYFIKCTGPAETMDAQVAAWEAMLASTRPTPAGAKAAAVPAPQ